METDDPLEEIAARNAYEKRKEEWYKKERKRVGRNRLALAGFALTLGASLWYGFSGRDAKAEALYEFQNPPKPAVVAVDEREPSIEVVVAESEKPKESIEQKAEKPIGKEEQKKAKPQYVGDKDSYYGFFCNAMRYHGTLRDAASDFGIPINMFAAQGIRESGLSHYDKNGKVKVAKSGDTGMYQLTKPAYNELRRFYHMKISDRDNWAPWFKDVQAKLRKEFPKGIPSWQKIRDDPETNIKVAAAFDYVCGEYLIKQRIGSPEGYAGKRESVLRWARENPVKFWVGAMSKYNAGPGVSRRGVYIDPIKSHATEITKRWKGF